MRTISFALLVATIATFSAAQAQVIDFEDRPVGARISAEYSARGVIFFNAYLDSDPHAHSGTKVLRRVSPSDEVFEAAPLSMTFTGPMSRVALFAGNVTGVTDRSSSGLSGAQSASVQGAASALARVLSLGSSF